MSAPYIDATLAIMKAFGVVIDQKSKYSEYLIKNNEYKQTIFDIPADLSTGALLIGSRSPCWWSSYYKRYQFLFSSSRFLYN